MCQGKGPGIKRKLRYTLWIQEWTVFPCIRIGLYVQVSTGTEMFIYMQGVNRGTEEEEEEEGFLELIKIQLYK